MRTLLSIAIAALFGFLAIGSGDGNSNLSESQKACKESYTMCASQRDLMEYSSEVTNARIECKMQAERLAKYGDPDFPWSPFHSYLPSENSANTGVITLFEKDAKFMNGFGAMKRSVVMCKYNLRTGTVIDLAVE